MSCDKNSGCRSARAMLQAVQQLWNHEHKALRAGDGKEELQFPCTQLQRLPQLIVRQQEPCKAGHNQLPVPLLYMQRITHASIPWQSTACDHPGAKLAQCGEQHRQCHGCACSAATTAHTSATRRVGHYNKHCNSSCWHTGWGMQAGRQTCMHTMCCLPLCTGWSTKCITYAAMTWSKRSAFSTG